MVYIILTPELVVFEPYVFDNIINLKVKDYNFYFQFSHGGPSSSSMRVCRFVS